MSVKLSLMSENLDNKIKNIKFEKKIPIKKVNISVVIFVFTVMFLI